jgi:hypothetical protein
VRKDAEESLYARAESADAGDTHLLKDGDMRQLTDGLWWTYKGGHFEIGVQIEAADAGGEGECKHDWRRDEPGSGWVYCDRCDCARSTEVLEQQSPTPRGDGAAADYGLILEAVNKASPRWGDAHDNPMTHRLTLREREWIAGTVMQVLSNTHPAPSVSGDGAVASLIVTEASVGEEWFDGPVHFTEAGKRLPVGTHHLYIRPAPDAADVGVELREAALAALGYIQVDSPEAERASDRLRAALRQSPGVAERGAKYSELLMAVARKFPGESRHETALRYIQQAESATNHCAAADDAARNGVGRG